jgi:hypothetical protein
MATAYVADTMNDQQIFIPGIIGAFVRPFSFNLTSTTGGVGFVVNDTVALAPIPFAAGAGGVMVLGYRVNVPALDTSTGSVVSIGDNNGTAGAFQATYYATKAAGQSSLGAVFDSLCAFNGTTTTPVLPVALTSNMPRSYTTTTVTATSTPYAFLAFILKITTAPTTATTTGVITGYLLMQPMGTQSVKYLNGATN